MANVESNIPLDEWKNWLSMRATEEFRQMLFETHNMLEERLKEVAFQHNDKEEAWTHLCINRGSIVTIRNLISMMDGLGEEDGEDA